MLVTVRDEATVRVSVTGDADREFARICKDNADLRIEQTRHGVITIMSPTRFRTSHRNVKILSYLDMWAEQDGRGLAADSNTVFLLPDGSKLGPDAAWISNKKLSAFSDSEMADFLPVAPEFIIELRSKIDRLKTRQQTMNNWIDNGVELGWLIDADARRVWIYRPNREPEKLMGPSVLVGEGQVASFRLVMDKIYDGPKV